jgi:hypothetical protein
MNIDEFIINLENVRHSEHIFNYDGLIASLKKLDAMIGMKTVKKNIISQIKYFLVNKSRNIPGLDSHMFHTVILGPPGCGKTSVAEIIAEIWASLGLIKNPNDNTNSENSSSRIDKIRNDFVVTNLRLTAEVISYKLKLEKIKNDIINEQTKVGKLTQYVRNIKPKTPDIKNISNKAKSLEIGLDAILYSNYGTTNDVIPSCRDEVVPNTPNTTTSVFNPEDYLIKLRRDDLVGKYLGQTAIKTREALTRGLNKIIFIDEAYELYNVLGDGSSDSFGLECLNTMLSFMNEHSDKCIIIFAGYENLLKDTIFRVQPGLERRIAWSFDIDPYEPEDLVQIFIKQLREKNWIYLDSNTETFFESKPKNLLDLFKANKKLFKFGGGDTLRLAMYTKTVYSNYSFNSLIKNEEVKSVITFEMVKDALKILKENCETQSSKIHEPPPGMYI